MVGEGQPLQVVEEVGLEIQGDACVDAALDVIADQVQGLAGQVQDDPERHGEGDDPVAVVGRQNLAQPCRQGEAAQPVVDQDLHGPGLDQADADLDQQDYHHGRHGPLVRADVGEQPGVDVGPEITAQTAGKA